jgi:hypothetical protein
MSSILKIRIPFFRRENTGSIGTFSLKNLPPYLPEVNQRVIITHTQVEVNSPLSRELNKISTNTVVGLFQNLEENTIVGSEINSFMILQYEGGFTASGNCNGFIEYDVNPTEEYSILKPIESAVVVNETVPFDLNTGFTSITNKLTTGSTLNLVKGSFVKRRDTNSIFSNLLKSLNLPVTVEEMKKYTRSDYGRLIEDDINFITTIDGVRYKWEQHITTGTTTDELVVHPVTGWTGEYYGTALQPIGSYEYTPTNKAVKPIENELYLIFEIPNGVYGELIDGKTVKFTLPYFTGTVGSNLISNKLGFYSYVNPPQEIELYGTYNKSGLNKTNLDRVLSETDLSVKDIGIKPDLNNNLDYESNVVLLFSDVIKTPESFTSWSDGYNELLDGARVFNPSAKRKALYDYKKDEAIGFVVLDKGFIVITHPKIVDSYFLNVFNGNITISNPTNLFTSTKNYDINGAPSTSLTRGQIKTDPLLLLTTVNNNSEIVWDSTQFVFSPDNTDSTFLIDSSLSYISYNTEKSLNIVCLASSDEFFKSTNDTAKELLGININDDFVDFKTEDKNLYPIVITQVGIHDEDGNLLAICKPVQPIKKFWYDVVSFNVRIRL